MAPVQKEAARIAKALDGFLVLGAKQIECYGFEYGDIGYERRRMRHGTDAELSVAS